MTRILRSAAKKVQNTEDLSSKLSINKKSKITKRRPKDIIEVKNEDIRQNKIWNINPILSNIFAYTNHKDLLEFNTVCKEWNNITNPIIHKTIKLDNRWDDSMRYFYKRINNAAKIDEDIKECISNNSKHAHLVKEFKFEYMMRPLRAIEVFETFRFITTLTIESRDMVQSQFLGMIRPLTQLQELNISFLKIKNVFRKNLYNEAVQLPSSLKKLRLGCIELVDNPELLIQTINSHSNLVEFSANTFTNNELFKPFYKNHPSLLNFEYENRYRETTHSLSKIFENNPQLISLELSFESWSGELISHINTYLINLEELKLTENVYYSTNDLYFFAKFSQPTKIKKLNLDWVRLSNCSLNSILLNCPYLEELDLNPCNHSKEPNSVKCINLFNPIKLKKLAINCNSLDEGVFSSLLLKCSNLNDLNISLPNEWKVAIKSIYENCPNLDRLSIFSPFELNYQEIDTFNQEFYKSELFTNNPKCKSTLTHLTLNNFKLQNSKAEYFKNFEKLKSIKYPIQFIMCSNSTNEEAESIKDSWPGYIVLLTDIDTSYDAELKRY